MTKRGWDVTVVDPVDLPLPPKYKKHYFRQANINDEPIEVRGGINWMDSLEKYAIKLDLPVKRHTFNFVRQSTALYVIDRIKS